MNTQVIKNWMELPEAILLPLEEIIGNGVQPQLQPLAIPCLVEIAIR